MRKVGWSVDQHAFDDNTPFGKYTFTNVIATLNPDAPRRYALSFDLRKEKLSCNFAEWSLRVITTPSWSPGAECSPATQRSRAPWCSTWPRPWRRSSGSRRRTAGTSPSSSYFSTARRPLSGGQARTASTGPGGSPRTGSRSRTATAESRGTTTTGSTSSFFWTSWGRGTWPLASWKPRPGTGTTTSLE